MHAPSKRAIIVILGLLALAVLVAGLVARRSPKPLKVDLATARTGRIIAQVSAPGHVAAVNQVSISAYVAGIITGLPVREGDSVHERQVLLQIDSTPYAAQARQAKANVNLAKVAFGQSKRIFLRQRALYTSRLISAQDMETARTQYQSDSARLALSRASLMQAQDQLNKTTLYSPIRGTVTQLNVKKGEVAVTGTLNIPGTVLMTVADLRSLEVDAEVDESDMPNVKLGQPANTELDALPDTALAGKVFEVGSAPLPASASAGENTSVTYEVKVTLPPRPAGVVPGMSATVNITVADRPDVLYVPLQCIVSRRVNAEMTQSRQRAGARNLRHHAVADTGTTAEREQNAVYIYEKGFARVRAVAIGVSDRNSIEILRGIAEGEKVISGPFSVLRVLKDGDRIEVDRKKNKVRSS
jgi:HlyD family secretion protein